jgi:hypothetical protein
MTTRLARRVLPIGIVVIALIVAWVSVWDRPDPPPESKNATPDEP